MLARFALAVERLARAGVPISAIAAELSCVKVISLDMDAKPLPLKKAPAK